MEGSHSGKSASRSWDPLQRMRRTQANRPCGSTSPVPENDGNTGSRAWTTPRLRVDLNGVCVGDGTLCAGFQSRPNQSIAADLFYAISPTAVSV